MTTWKDAVRGASLAASLVAVLAACGAPGPPSAHCKHLVRQVVYLQADARVLRESDALVTSAGLAEFSHDVKESGRLLRQAKAEGCPAKGYPGGYHL